jgi:hypothetical protein
MATKKTQPATTTKKAKRLRHRRRREFIGSGVIIQIPTNVDPVTGKEAGTLRLKRTDHHELTLIDLQSATETVDGYALADALGALGFVADISYRMR